jgi:hypothetical protein
MVRGDNAFSKPCVSRRRRRMNAPFGKRRLKSVNYSTGALEA